MKILQKEERMISRFLDVGAVVYYLKATPWESPGFDTKAHTEELLGLHRQIRSTGGFRVTTSRFYVEARKD